jgi:hypothetical protein
LLGKLGENLRLRDLREEVREDALQRIPHGRQALARQVTSTQEFRECLGHDLLIPGSRCSAHPSFPAGEKKEFINIKDSFSIRKS